jgi:hypothetical protein
MTDNSGGPVFVPETSIIYTANLATVKFTPSTNIQWGAIVGAVVLHSPNQIEFNMEYAPDLSSSPGPLGCATVVQVTILQTLSLPLFPPQKLWRPRAEYVGIFAFLEAGVYSFGFNCQLVNYVQPGGGSLVFAIPGGFGLTIMKDLAVTTGPRFTPAPRPEG